MKNLLMILAVIIVIYAAYLYVGYGYCDFGSLTTDIKNYSGICKSIVGWY